MKQIIHLCLIVQCYLTLFISEIKTLETWQSLNDKLNEKINKSAMNDIIKRDRNLENDLRGRVIDAILQNKLPYLEVKNEFDRSVKLRGFIGELWHILEEHLQFKTKYTNISNERALELHLGDISLNPVALKPAHIDKFAISIPLSKIWYCLFTKDVPNEGGSIWFYVTVLRSRMRKAIIYVVSLFIIMHWISNWLRFYFRVDNRIDNKIINKKARIIRRRIKKKLNTETFDTTIIYSILCILGLLTNQGSQQAARSYSSRIFNLVCMLFAIMICTSYSAVLISKLAIYGNRIQLRSIRALLNSGTHALCVAENSFAAHYLKNPGLRTDPIVPYNWSYAMNRKPCTLGNKDMVAFEDFCADKTVVMETEPNSIYVISGKEEPNQCVIIFDPTKYFQSFIALIAKKDWKYTATFNKYFMKMIETGIIEKLKTRWLPTGNELISENKYIISLRDVEGLFHVYFSALIITVIIFILEIIIYNFSKSKVGNFIINNFRHYVNKK